MPELAFERPRFSVHEAESAAAELYGLTGTAIPLPSERDQNFRLTSNGIDYVLKIARPAVSPLELDLECTLMERLAGGSETCRTPVAYRCLSGQLVAGISREGQQHLVRLLSFLPGKVLAHVRPQPLPLLEGIGKAIAEIDRALMGVEHAAARRDLKWDLSKPEWIRDYVDHVAQPERRRWVEQVLATWDADTAPVVGGLRRGIIHNDANDYNILVNDRDRLAPVVAGIVDFGDALEAPLVCELAIACAYVAMHKPDPLSAACGVVRGFHSVLPLLDSELAVLHSLIAVRLAVSVTNAAYQRTATPDNPYLTISEEPAWTLLERWLAVHPRLASYAFREACGLEPCAASGDVVSWLRRNPDLVSAPVRERLTAENTVVFDLGVASPQLSLSELSDVAAFSKSLFNRMSDHGARIGIGRYDEARPLYTSPLFRTEGNDGPEWRTVHIGMDIFMEAGTPVVAPLDGRVHSYQINTGDLDYGPTVILEHTTGDGLSFYTLYGHLSPDSLDGLATGVTLSRGTEFARIGSFPDNGNWPPHLHFQIICDLLDKRGEFPGVALPSQRRVWTSISPDPNWILELEPSLVEVEDQDSALLLEDRRRRIGPSLSLSYRRPLHIVRGYMQHLYDNVGRAYLDTINNVAHVGHSHPSVVEAAAQQMRVLNTNTRYLHGNITRYAERLCSTLPEPLSVCYFVCSGSEANELALRLARCRVNSKQTLVMDAGYHGNTNALVEISPYKFNGAGGSGAAPFVHVLPIPADSEDFALPEAGPLTFIAESVLSCAGQIVLPPGYLASVYSAVRATGGVCIADEVQTGFGRTGTHFWAFETHGVVPDVVTMGKPIGNGHPLGAVVTTREIADAFNNGMEYFNTFGGNPVSCAIGLAVLDVIEREGLQERARAVGDVLTRGLKSIGHAAVRDVRGSGLFLGVELVDGEFAKFVVNRMCDRGFLMSSDGPLHNVLKIKPPMVFSMDDAQRLVAALHQTCDEY